MTDRMKEIFCENCASTFSATITRIMISSVRQYKDACRLKYNNNPHISQQNLHLCIDHIISLDIPITRLHSHSITGKLYQLQ